jgi:fused signal recognition particle receptor
VRSIGASLSRLFKGTALSEQEWEELEEVLLRADVGVAATQRIVGALRARNVTDGMAALREELIVALGHPDRSLKTKPSGTTVWLVTGVNGVGKTTTIGKLAAQLRDEGRSVVLAAADTFRAAADTQLEVWAQRSGADIVKHAPGADPAAVVFDGIAAARARSRDVLIVDTAGRLQTKKNLMEELGKIRRILDRETGAPDEVLLVLDATTGQNGVAQARAFAEVAGITGVVLTKLDGTAKGGIVIAVQQELSIPVKLVGLGEGIGDLASFDPDGFVDDLLGISP